MRSLVIIGLILSLNLQAQSNLSVSNGSVLAIDNGVVLTISDANLYNEGQLIASGGSLAVQNNDGATIEGNGIFSLHHLFISAINQVDILADFYISNDWNIEQGLVNIYDSEIELGLENGQLLGEDDDSYVYTKGAGRIIKSFEFDRPTNVSPGNLGFEISSSESLGYGELIRSHTPIDLEDGRSIERVFRLSTDSKRQSPIAVKLFYRDDEKPSSITQPTLWVKNELTSLALFTSNNGQIGQSTRYLGGTANADFNLFTIGEEQIDLLVEDTPTAFTPNGDGKNDTFYIPFLESVDKAHVMIFNRWGERLYESSNYLEQPWDGRWKGKVMDPNTFYYKIRLEGNEIIEGQISIIR